MSLWEEAGRHEENIQQPGTSFLHRAAHHLSTLLHKDNEKEALKKADKNLKILDLVPRVWSMRSTSQMLVNSTNRNLYILVPGLQILHSNTYLCIEIIG